MSDPFATQTTQQQAADPWATSPTERTWAMVAHGGSLIAAWFAMGVLAPLLVLLVKGSESRFVRYHAVESLNFQISLLIYTGIAVVLAIITFGIGLLVIIPVVIVFALVALIVIVQATLRAGEGREYRYPLTFRLIS